MGLFSFLKSLIFGSSPSPDAPAASTPSGSAQSPAAPSAKAHSAERARLRDERRAKLKNRPLPRLKPLRYQPSLVKTPPAKEVVATKPYPFASPAGYGKKFLNFSNDGDARWLDYFGLPQLNTPEDLANWLGIPLGKLAWLTNRDHSARRPKSQKSSHYCYSFRLKRSGGFRLIEAPKPLLAEVQRKILREILDNVPTHPAAHGFVQGRSIVTNARPHVGKRFVLKLDLEEFYPSVKYSRVVAIFRSLGFSREVSLWLGQLTTTSIPWNLELPGATDRIAKWQFQGIYHARHLPQGAPTSPALANLSAFALDVRLSGLATAYGMTYTRYADDMTFSGESRQVPALRDFIPLAMQVIRSERFRVNRAKRKVLRSNQRQSVTGVVVNEKLNISRREYDRLKATLTNCVKQGPSTQNRDQHENFAHHLRGRIAHVLQLNRTKGEKLLKLYARIDWKR